MPTSLRVLPPLPMTMPFCESRSTRISQRTRGHSHSVTRQAMLWGSSSSHPVEQLLAHQVGHPEGLGHVGDHALGVVAGPLGHPGHHRVDQARRRPRRWRPTPGSTPPGPGRPPSSSSMRLDHVGDRGEVGEDPVPADPVDLVDHHQQGRVARPRRRRPPSRRWRAAARAMDRTRRADCGQHHAVARAHRPRWPRPWPPPRRRRPAMRPPIRSSARPGRCGACAAPGCRRRPPGRPAG